MPIQFKKGLVSCELFYRTQDAARAGDLLMTLIHTCELCGANPFDYLTEPQRQPRTLTDGPCTRVAQLLPAPPLLSPLLPQRFG